MPAGVTSFTVTAPTSEDALVEADETFTLTVGGVTATGTITNDDSTAIDAVGGGGGIANVGVAEGESAVFTVTLSAESAIAQSFALTLAGNTATLGTDFTDALSFSDGVTYADGTITVPAGVTSFTVTVPTSDDALVELTESFALNVGGVVATGSITDDDLAPEPPPVAAVAGPTMPAATVVVAVPASPASPDTPEFPPVTEARMTEFNAQRGDHDLRVDKAIPDQVFPADTAEIHYVVPVDAFVHTDENARVDLAALMLDGSPLPPWLQFDPKKGEFVGVPPAGFQGELMIKVVARDEAGRQAETLIRIIIGNRQDQSAALLGRQGLSSQFMAQGILAWKAERDLLVKHARDARHATSVATRHTGTA